MWGIQTKDSSTQGYIKHNVNDDLWGTGNNGKGHSVFGLLLAALRGGVKE